LEEIYSDRNNYVRCCCLFCLIMNILFIDSHNPFDPQKNGSAQRSHLLIEACAKIAHVDVVSFFPNAVSDIDNCDVVFSQYIRDQHPVTRKRKLKRILTPWSINAYYPVIHEAEKAVDALMEKGCYDWIVARYMEEALQFGVLKYGKKLIVDVDDRPDDVEWMLAIQAKTLRSKLYHAYTSLSMKLSLDRAIKSTALAFFPNKNQARYVNSVYLPNIPYYAYNQLPFADNQSSKILFVGDLRYEPNFMGIEHFVENIWPEVLKQVPDAKLRIVGKYNAGWDRRLLANGERLKANGIEVLGFVDDLKDAYKEANVCVIPVYTGAGTNIKVLEALQMNRACVISEQSYKGFSEYLKSGKDLFVAKTDEEFAADVIELMKSPSKNAEMAKNGYAAVDANYSRTNFNAIVKEAIERL